MPIEHGLRFPIDEIIAGVQGTLGLLVSDVWKQMTGQEEQVTIDLFHSYLSFSGIFFVRQNGYEIYPWDPQYPTLGHYKTRDELLIYINGGYLTLRDKILKVLDGPNDFGRVAEAISQRDSDALEDAFTAAASCAAVVREKNEWLHIICLYDFWS